MFRDDAAAALAMSRTGRSPVTQEQGLAVCCQIAAANYVETAAAASNGGYHGKFASTCFEFPAPSVIGVWIYGSSLGSIVTVVLNTLNIAPSYYATPMHPYQAIILFTKKSCIIALALAPRKRTS